MPGDQPKVSIVLPTYNGASFLSQSMKSCLEQTYTPIELIIVDDASTDETPQIVAKFNHPAIKYFRLDRNQGHIAALNFGFSKTEGDLLTWTSDDNYYEPFAIATMANVLKTNKAIDFVYANYYVIDAKAQIQRLGRVESSEYLDEDNCVGGCFLYRRQVYQTLGTYHEEAFLAEDYEFWLRVRTQFKMKKIDQILYYYREHDRSLTGVHKEDKVQAQVEQIRERFIPSWKSAYLKGKKFYYQKDYSQAGSLLWQSFKSNPFYPFTWRLLIFILLGDSMVNVLRTIKKRMGL